MRDPIIEMTQDMQKEYLVNHPHATEEQYPLGWGFWDETASRWQGGYQTQEAAARARCRYVAQLDYTYESFVQWAKHDEKNPVGVLQTYADIWAEDRDEIKRLEARLSLYETALIAYGDHKPWCATRSRNATVTFCNCHYQDTIHDLFSGKD